eukprot:gene3895-15206_t
MAQEFEEATDVSATITETIERIETFSRKAHGGGELERLPSTSTPTRSSILRDVRTAPQPTSPNNQSGGSCQCNQGVTLLKRSLQKGILQVLEGGK